MMSYSGDPPFSLSGTGNHVIWRDPIDKFHRYNPYTILFKKLGYFYSLWVFFDSLPIVTGNTPYTYTQRMSGMGHYTVPRNKK